MSSSSQPQSQSQPSNPNLNPNPDPNSPPSPAQGGKIEYPIPTQVLNAIHVLKNKGKKVVVMTCGIAGSSSILSLPPLPSSHPHSSSNPLNPITPGNQTIDKFILERHGVYALDYEAERVGVLQDEAEGEVKLKLRKLLKEEDRGAGGSGDVEGGEEGGQGEGGGSCIVLDLSLWCKADRDFYQAMVEKEGGGRWGVVLVVFRVRIRGAGDVDGVEDERVLWGRIVGREREVAGMRREG
ncbi:hypothetical protein IFR05_014731, partial [Cadophora sp. M221]